MYKIDETDNAILEILKDDGRCSYSEIGKQVHLSRVAVRERIANMKNCGIIHGFTVVIDSKAYQKMASVFLEIEVEPNKLDIVARKLVERREIAIVSQHSGASGLHVHAYIDSLEGLSNYLSENIFNIDGVRAAQTYLLLRQYKMNTYLTKD